MSDQQEQLLQELRQEIALLRQEAKRHDAELKAHETSIGRIETQIHYILTARVWRGLQFAGRLVSRFLPEKSRTPWAPTEKEYQTWIKEYDGADRQTVLARLPHLKYRPTISIVVPVYNTDPLVLEATIQSVRTQHYENWELCLADDRSTRSSVIELLKRVAAEDERIKVVFRTEQGGISNATNDALAIATGEYIAFLDHDDVLTEHALAAVCEAINAHPEAGLFYSDEDKLDNRGVRYHPVFKADWSPDLLLSSNYICHFVVVKRSLQQAVGGLRSAFDGSQDYDFLLRIANTKPNVFHIPKILYHWRAVPGSTAGGLDSKSYAVDAARKALAENCERQEDGSKVEPAGVVGWWRIRYPIPEGTTATVVVDAKNAPALSVRTTLDSLLEKTAYRHFDITVLLRNDAGRAALVDDFKHAQTPIRFDLGTANGAAQESTAGVLVFLRAPTIVLSSDWLQALLEQALRPEIAGAVPKVLGAKGSIASAGLVLGINGLFGDAFAGLHGSTPHYFGISNVLHNVSAGSARCLATSRERFEQLGAFDEAAFSPELAVPDYCLRAGKEGLRIVYTPYALLQQEAVPATAGREEAEVFRKRWAPMIEADPYYNVNLTRTRTDYSLRRKGR